MSVVLYHDYTYFAIKQISSFSSSCKSVKHRLHFSEVECSHCFSSSARSLFPQDKNRNFRLQPDSSDLKHGRRTAPRPRHADILQVGAILEYRRVRACCFRIIIAHSFQSSRQYHARDACLFERIALDYFHLRLGEVNDAGQAADLKKRLKADCFQVGCRRKINEHLLAIKIYGLQFLSARRIPFATRTYPYIICLSPFISVDMHYYNG